MFVGILTSEDRCFMARDLFFVNSDMYTFRISELCALTSDAFHIHNIMYIITKLLILLPEKNESVLCCLVPWKEAFPTIL
jgi:hypothetical protein